MTLTEYITANGPIKTARVSSAQARGAAKKYPYWGVVRYEIRLRKHDGAVINVAVERATSDRRSHRLAGRDLQALCGSENRIEVSRIGELPIDVQAEILDQVSNGAKS